jgi:ubiquinol-cytochrome c reductase cytochrome b subunit
MMWTDGLGGTWPAWEFYIGNYTIPQSVWVALGMGLVSHAADRLPVHREEADGDDAHHNLLQRPRDAPTRTAVGAAAISFYLLLTFMCMNDIIA